MEARQLIRYNFKEYNIIVNTFLNNLLKNSIDYYEKTFTGERKTNTTDLDIKTILHYQKMH